MSDALVAGIRPERLEKLRAREAKRFAAGRPKAKAALADGADVFLDGVPLHWMKDWPMPHLPLIAKAKGARITDIDGHEVVDAVGGLWNVNLGYSCQPIKDAIAGQLDRLPYYSTFRGTSNDVVIELAEELRKFFEPDGLVRADRKSVV